MTLSENRDPLFGVMLSLEHDPVIHFSGSCSTQTLHHFQNIPAADPGIRDLVHQVTNQVHAEPADRAPLERQREVGRRRLQRIERPAVVLDLEQHAVGRPAHLHHDLAAHAGVIAVTDGVAYCLVEHDVERIDYVGRQMLRGAEGFDAPGQLSEAGQIIGEAQLDEIGHDFVRGLAGLPSALARGPSERIASSTLRKMRSGSSTSWMWKRASASWARTDSRRAIANTISCACNSRMTGMRVWAAVSSISTIPAAS